MTSDALGSYLDGVDGVSSKVDAGSDYDLTLGKRKRGADRTVSYDFSQQVRAGACSGRECDCSALPRNTIDSSTGYLRVNLEPDGALCAMRVGTAMSARATARVGDCWVAWNPSAPGAPVDVDGVTVTRTSADRWTARTNGTGRAWLWSEGRRNVRVDEGVFDMPFGGTIDVLEACQ